MSRETLETLVKILLPQEIFEYFDVSHIFQDATTIRLHLEELNLHPQEYQTDKLISKGANGRKRQLVRLSPAISNLSIKERE